LAALPIPRRAVFGYYVTRNGAGDGEVIMAGRKVFVFWTHILFHETVQALLNHPLIEWLGSSSDLNSVMDPSLNPRPDVIIIEEESGSQPIEVIQILENSRWNVRLVGLNLEDNQMRVYDFTQHTVQNADDLLHWIVNE
jgi:hypothetical protein